MRNKLKNGSIKAVQSNKSVSELPFYRPYFFSLNITAGNPPYQRNDGGSKASAVPIYDKFVLQSKEMDAFYVSLIIPAKWFNGGRGLDDFRTNMLSDSSLRVLTDYPNSEDCFPGVDVAGGICHFLWAKEHHGQCVVREFGNGGFDESIRNLNEYDTFIRSSQAIPILEKVRAGIPSEYLESHVSSQKPFGLRTYVKPKESGDLVLRYSGGTGPYPSSEVVTNCAWINKWKVIMSYLTYDHAGRPDKEGKRRIFSTIEILPPQAICTETYLVIDVFDSEIKATNFLSYLKTRFVRFMVSLVTATQHISKSSFCYVPDQDFSRPWTDEELYAKYGLTEEEITFIDSMIKPMDGGATDAD